MFQNILNAQLDHQKPNNLNIIYIANLVTVSVLENHQFHNIPWKFNFFRQNAKKVISFQLFQPTLKISSISRLFHLLQLFQPCGNPATMTKLISNIQKYISISQIKRKINLRKIYEIDKRWSGVKIKTERESSKNKK